MATQRKETRLTLGEIAQALDRGLAGADPLRAMGLAGLQRVRAAKANGLQREQTRLRAKLGANHPRVVALSQLLEANRDLTQALQLEAERATIELPPRDSKNWVLHGRVLSQELTGIPCLTVALYDAGGNWIESLGYAATGANGYFRLIAGQGAWPARRPVYLRVLNTRAEHVYIDQAPLTPEADQAEYREIYLASDLPVCAPPPVPHRREPVPDADTWIVRGHVTDEQGQGLGDLIVSLYDADLLFDDRLGQTETDAQGQYTFIYRTADFDDLIERRPDIYLKVLDQNGNTLYTSEATIRCEAGRVEIVNVTLRRGQPA
jgi:hypothetical protein